MPRIPVRTVALICSFLVPPSFAQTVNRITAASAEAAAGSESANALPAAMRQAIARAIAAAISPPGEEALPADQPQGQTQGGQKPPPTNPPPPSLGDLGFPPAQTQGNAQEQAKLDKRSHMLKIHQRLGLITTAPLVATVITGSLAGGKSMSSTDRDLHAALGSVTAGLYLTTAYFSIFAPKVPGTPTRGPIRLHKALAWIHGPGMILTPVLGAMAYEQKNRGEKLHGIAQAHSPVAIVTAGAYGLAILSVSIKF